MNTCSIRDCGKPSRARGWCQNHYAQWRYHNPDAVNHPAITVGCTTPGCDRTHFGRGWCRRCYYVNVTRPRHRASSWDAKRAALIEDVEDLAGTDTPTHIARRLGYDKPASLARRLERAGRSDLAYTFREVA